MIRFIFFLFLFLFTYQVNAQFMFRRTYGLGNINEGRCIIQTNDKGYAVCGSTTPYSGGQTDFYLLKIDSTGIPEFQKSFGSPGIDQSFALVQLPDSGYLIAGYSNGYSSNNDYDVCLIRTDKDGNSVWIKTFGTTNWDFIYDIKSTPDGNFILAGNSYGSGNGSSSGYLVKVDTVGNVIWQKFTSQNQLVFFKQIAIRNDGSIVACGNVSPSVSYEGDYFIAVADVNGDTIRTMTIDAGKHESFNAIGLFSNGDFALAGNSMDSTQNEISDESIFRIDSLGTVIWSYTFSDTAFFSGNDETNDLFIYNDTLMTIGSTSSGGSGNTDFHVVQFDSNGSFIRGNTYGFLENEFAYSGLLSNDGGFVFAGTSTTYGPGQQSIFIVKSDSIFTYDPNVTINIEKPVINYSFNISPNPSNGRIFISSNEINDEIQLKVFNIEGKLLLERNEIPPTETDLSDLNPGVYYLELYTPKKVERRKVVITGK